MKKLYTLFLQFLLVCVSVVAAFFLTPILFKPAEKGLFEKVTDATKDAFGYGEPYSISDTQILFCLLVGLVVFVIINAIRRNSK